MSDRPISNIENKLSAIEEKVANIGERAGKSISEASVRVKEQASKIQGGLAEHGDRTLQELSQNIRKQPLTAVLLATGIGFVLGKLGARR